MNKIFSQRLKALRKENGYTQNYLSEMLDIGRTNISNCENGVCMPDLDTITKLASILGVKADYLLGSAQNPPSTGLDFSKLNAAGIENITNYYRFLLNDKRYTKTKQRQ